jgi:hypothetical protein
MDRLLKEDENERKIIKKRRHYPALRENYQSNDQSEGILEIINSINDLNKTAKRLEELASKL